MCFSATLTTKATPASVERSVTISMSSTLYLDRGFTNWIFSFTDKAEQKADLPFSFGTQSSEAGEISFLNQMKSQDAGESFALDNSQKNMGGINFLKTIYEVPESSNNIFNSEADGFPLQSVPMGLDFIREGNEDNLNFDSFHNNKQSSGEEGINVDINNLFKNSASPPMNNTSHPQSKNDSNKKMNIQLSAKKTENPNKNIINPSDNNININKMPSFPSNQNKNINIAPEAHSNPMNNPRQTRPNNLPIIPENNNNNIISPQFQNISIKPQIIKEPKNNNLDDIDKMISMNLQTKQPENKQANKNIINNNINNLSNEISDIFSSTS